MEVGQPVSRGDQLARCGNSGNSTEPHVHLQVTDSITFPGARGLPFVFTREDGSVWLPRNAEIVEG